MAGESNYSPYVIVGKLSRDFILTEDGEDINDIPGGHLLYTAIGMSPWERNPGLVAKVGNKYPQEFLDQLRKYGFSLHGVKKVDFDLEQRHFISYRKSSEQQPAANQSNRSVLSQYVHAGKPFPKALLGYNKSASVISSVTERTSETVLARDIPPEFQEARCVHLCPLDYLSHNLLPQAFFGTHKRTITIHASSAYMYPHFFEAVKTLVNGLTTFFVREQYLLNLFYEKYRIKNIDDMMKILLEYGAENIIVKMNDRTFRFINRFDNRVYNLAPDEGDDMEKLGSFSCFCGAYVVGLNTTYDYKKAAAYGAARESLLRNEWKPFHNLNVFETLLMEKARIMENKIEG